MYMSNICRFTLWDTVILDDKDEIKVNKFFKILEKNLGSFSYNVYYNSDKRKFYITYAGVDYLVSLPFDVERSLSNNQYPELVVRLMNLSKKEREINSILSARRLKDEKLNRILNSSYEEIVDVCDYALYLDYLKKQLKSTKDKKAQKVIQTKISCILDKIRGLEENKKNPLSLKNYFYRFIYALLEKANALNAYDRSIIMPKIKKIAIDYNKILQNFSKRNKSQLIVGDPVFSREILDRIVEVELLIDEMKKNENRYFSLDEIEQLQNALINDCELDKGGVTR